MIIKEMFYIPIKLKPELARASMATSDVNNQWRSNFQQKRGPKHILYEALHKKMCLGTRFYTPIKLQKNAINSYNYI
jgi:hypothetical protein